MTVKADFHSLESERAGKTRSMTSNPCAVIKISADIMRWKAVKSTRVQVQKLKTCTLHSNKRTIKIRQYTYNNTMMEASTRYGWMRIKSTHQIFHPLDWITSARSLFKEWKSAFELARRELTVTFRQGNINYILIINIAMLIFRVINFCRSFSLL